MILGYSHRQSPFRPIIILVQRSISSAESTGMTASDRKAFSEANDFSIRPEHPRDDRTEIRPDGGAPDSQNGCSILQL